VRSTSVPGSVILVRGDAERILTCALDYSSSRVQVTDILHEQSPQGWQLRTSAYHKLRLGLADVAREVEAAGLTLQLNEEQRGWLTVVATPG
jgi:hypothetical protein